MQNVQLSYTILEMTEVQGNLEQKYYVMCKITLFTFILG